MKPVFADTVYFLALLNPVDQWHRQARSLSVQPHGPLLTTEFMLAPAVLSSHASVCQETGRKFGKMRRNPESFT